MIVQTLRAAACAALVFCSASPVLGQGAKAKSASKTSTSQTKAPALAKLVVVITVDQLRPDYFTRFGSQLTGGLARLYNGGAVFTNAFQDHGITETAPGHAAILSGRFPVHTGIVTNSQGVMDTSVKLLDAPGRGASPFRFKGTTLADWMMKKYPSARVLSVSRKDRSAILPVGRAKQHVYWYAANGSFTTSTYYRLGLPTWVKAFNAQRIPQGYAGKAWTPLLPASEYAEPDSVPAENGGEAFTFPHEVPSEVAFATQGFGGFPWMDELTLRFALDGVQALGLGTGPQPDLLAVSLSATDGIGHLYGPDSREMHDQILRLDRYLGAFLDSLFALRGEQNVVVALTADHGVSPYPEAKSRDPNQGARRVDLSEMVRVTAMPLRAAGLSPRAFMFEDGVLMVDRSAFSSAKINADSVVNTFAVAARKVPGVLRADRITALALADTVADPIARRWLHMFSDETDVSLVVTLTPYSYWLSSGAAQHGSPHDYDAHVPIIFYGAPFKPGKQDAFVRVVDIAPTLARVMRLTPSETLDGRALTSVLR